MASSRSVAADEDQPGSDERPQKADVLVFSEGEHADDVIKPQDLKLGGPAGARLAEGFKNLGGPQGLALERVTGRKT